MTIYAASAISAVTSSRSLMAFVFLLFSNAMLTNLGVGWTMSVLALIVAVVGIPAPFLLYKYGPFLRSKSKYCVQGWFWMQCIYALFMHSSIASGRELLTILRRFGYMDYSTIVWSVTLTDQNSGEHCGSPTTRLGPTWSRLLHILVVVGIYLMCQHKRCIGTFRGCTYTCGDECSFRD